MLDLTTLLVLMTTGVACVAPSEWGRHHGSPFAINYKYNITDLEDVPPLAKDGHSVQIGKMFSIDELGFWGATLDYTYLRGYPTPSNLSLGLDTHVFPVKLFANLFGKTGTPAMEKYLMSFGVYKILNKSSEDWLVNGNISAYTFSLGNGVEISPTMGTPVFGKGRPFGNSGYTLSPLTLGLNMRFGK